MINLADKLNSAVGAKQGSEKDVKEVVSTELKRATNRSITCSVELRDRLRIMAATKGIPMQDILESWIRKELDAAGF